MPLVADDAMQPNPASRITRLPAAMPIAPLCALTLALALASCSDASNRADVYEERVPAAGLDSERAFAYRITLFEYSRKVGGFIEFYEIDGVRNTWVNPYFAASACDYFGAGRLQNDEFPVEAEGVDGRLLMTVTLVDGGKRLVARLTEAGGTWAGDIPSGGASIEFERTDTTPSRACDHASFSALDERP